MKNVYDTLLERGYIAQTTHEQEIKDLLANESVTFYIGFDPTADSLHVGHYIQMMVMAHMQQAGHRPIALIGGGTAMVGDPSGRNDMRSMMTKETIAHNADCFVKQMSRLIDFSDGKAIMVNNADWLTNLNYIDFLRDVGACFSVNKMLTAECFKQRLEKGLTFLEFNYMLMQGYDFLVLNQKYGAKLELGGDDQWSNILAGTDLIRRKENKQAYGMTFKLLTNSEGKKMGKTQSGAVWLSAEKTSPYDFYQYWRNIDDADVKKCMLLLTFMPIEEINELTAHLDERMNAAKARLAYEITKLIHGEEEAAKAQAAAQALFGGGANNENIPSVEITADQFNASRNILDMLVVAGIAASKSEGRRLVQQGGITLNDVKVADFAYNLQDTDVTNNEFILKKGKKVFVKVIVK